MGERFGALLHESFSPQVDGMAADTETSGDFPSGQTIGQQEDNAATEYGPLD